MEFRETSACGEAMRGRRAFLQSSAALLAAMALPRIARAASCELTTQDAIGLGPFYLENTAVKTVRLAPESEPGEKLRISGVVRDCSGPLPGALVEVWQANTVGCYSDFPQYQSCAEDPAPGHLRGTFIADAEARYGFSTVMPGSYTDGGGKYRTPHIHYRVTLPPESGFAAELITQLYFQGEAYLDVDDGAGDAFSTSGNQRIIPLTPAVGGGREGVFDIYLADSSTNLRRGPSTLASIWGFDVMIRREGSDGRSIRFLLPAHRLRGEVRLRILELSGRVLQSSHHANREIRWDASRFAAGAYLVEMIAGDGGRESFPIRL
jgi:catechol 1,2-dioxygenase